MALLNKEALHPGNARAQTFSPGQHCYGSMQTDATFRPNNGASVCIGLNKSRTSRKVFGVGGGDSCKANRRKNSY